MTSGGSSPGLGGAAVGGEVGFGYVGEARACCETWVEIKGNVEADSMNVEKYVKELTNTTIDMTKATGGCLSRSTSR